MSDMIIVGGNLNSIKETLEKQKYKDLNLKFLKKKRIIISMILLKF